MNIYTHPDLFYCYNVKLYKFLSFEKKIKHLTTAKNEKDDRIFAIFNRTEQLAEAIREYRVLHNL